MRGHVECVIFYQQQTQDWPAKATSTAAVYDQFDILQYLCENGCPWNPRTTFWAATNESMQMLKYCLDNNCPWDPNTALAAAQRNKEWIQHIYEHYGDAATWDINMLEDFETNTYINEETKEYLRSVADSWKRGDNKTTWVKPAK